MTKLFVTGGTGFIGSNFINEALKEGHNIVALKRSKNQEKAAFQKNIVWLTGELDSPLQKEVSECDVLIHISSAGVSPQNVSWEECFESNVTKPLKLLKNAIQVGTTKIIVIGTAAEYGNSASRYDELPVTAPLEPIGAYASSKCAFFMAVHGLAVENNIKLLYLRLFSVYGEGQYEKNLWPSLKNAATSGVDFPMTHGEQVRDFIHVKEVSKKIIKAIEFSSVKSGIPIVQNIGSGERQTVLQFSKFWWKKFNATGKLLPGAIPYRDNEVMNLFPKLN